MAAPGATGASADGQPSPSSSRDHQALPRGGGELGHRPRIRPAGRSMPSGRERGRQVDPDEDPLREQRPDEGTISVNGREISFRTRPDAIEAGIGMVTSTSCSPTTSRCWRTRPRAPRHGIGGGAAGGSWRSPTPTPSDWTPTPWSRTSASVTAARGDRQGALPRCADPDPGRADRRAGAHRGRRAVRQPQEFKREGLTVIFISHKLDEVRSRRRDHRHPPGHHGGRGRPEDHVGARARRDDGRCRAAHAGHP